MTNVTWTRILLVVLSVGSLSTSSARWHPRGHKKKDQKAVYYHESKGYGHGDGYTKTDFHPNDKITVEGKSKSKNYHGHTYGSGHGYIKDGHRKHSAEHGSYGSYGGEGHVKVNSGGTKDTDYGKTTIKTSSHGDYGYGSGYGSTHGRSKDRYVGSYGYGHSSGHGVHGVSAGGGGSSDIGLKSSAAYSLAGGKSDDHYGENYQSAGGYAHSRRRGGVESYSSHYGKGKSAGVSAGLGASGEKYAGSVHVTGGASKKYGYTDNKGHTSSYSDDGKSTYAYGHTKTKGHAKGGTATIGLAVPGVVKGSGGVAVAKGEGGYVKATGGSGTKSHKGETKTKQTAAVHGHGEVKSVSLATENSAYASSSAKTTGGHAYGSAHASSNEKKSRGY